MAGGAPRLTTFSLPEQENLGRPFVPFGGDPVSRYLLVNGIAGGLGARLLSFPFRPFFKSFIFGRNGIHYERVPG